MYIYNVTININQSDHDKWLIWMRDFHIPDMLATGKFTEARMCRVMIEEEMGGITYSIQYLTKDKETLQKYYQEDAERLRADGFKHFGNNIVAFRTELDFISEHKTTSLGATEYLFTYGTLQDPAIQATIFSRKLEGQEDRLIGYKISEKKIVDLYSVIKKSENAEDMVNGKVYLVANTELIKADAYEGVAYTRFKLRLESGISAWVYVGNSNVFKPA